MLVVACPSCSKKLMISPELLGKMVRCSACQTVFEANLVVEDERTPEPELVSGLLEKKAAAPTRADDPFDFNGSGGGGSQAEANSLAFDEGHGDGDRPIIHAGTKLRVAIRSAVGWIWTTVLVHSLYSPIVLGTGVAGLALLIASSSQAIEPGPFAILLGMGLCLFAGLYLVNLVLQILAGFALPRFQWKPLISVAAVLALLTSIPFLLYQVPIGLVQLAAIDGFAIPIFLFFTLIQFAVGLVSLMSGLSSLTSLSSYSVQEAFENNRLVAEEEREREDRHHDEDEPDDRPRRRREED